MGVTIFTMTHKRFPAPKDNIYVPVHVGRALAQDLGYIGDDTGVNISEKNCYYGELTGVYWVWKNIKTTDYVGICHYRRYFCTEEGRILTVTDYENLLSAHDMIASKKLKLNYSYFDGYASDYHIMDLITVGEAIRQLYPEYYPVFEKLVHGKGTYFGNMMVCSKTLYDEYCDWLFSIFSKAEEKINAAEYDDYHKRVYGFISEFLLMVWAEAKNLRVYECKIGMTGEKQETAEIKEQLARYFAQRQIAPAKEYILACLKKRPDVLMEASDITGELKLSMQVIAVCESEQEIYGKSVIGQLHDFEGLMQYFRHINDAILQAIHYISVPENRISAVEDEFITTGYMTQVSSFNGAVPAKNYAATTASAYSKTAIPFESIPVTDIALEISARLFCPVKDAQAVAHAARCFL